MGCVLVNDGVVVGRVDDKPLAFWAGSDVVPLVHAAKCSRQWGGCQLASCSPCGSGQPQPRHTLAILGDDFRQGDATHRTSVRLRHPCGGRKHAGQSAARKGRGGTGTTTTPHSPDLKCGLTSGIRKTPRRVFFGQAAWRRRRQQQESDLNSAGRKGTGQKAKSQATSRFTKAQVRGGIWNRTPVRSGQKVRGRAANPETPNSPELSQACVCGGGAA